MAAGSHVRSPLTGTLAHALALSAPRATQAPPLSKLRGCAGAAALDGRIYVAGGGVAEAQYDTVEVFNPQLDAWIPGGEGWRLAQRCSLRARRCGRERGGSSALRSAARVQTAVLRLTPPAGPRLHDRRFSTAAGVLGGCVYVTGGYDGSYLRVGAACMYCPLPCVHMTTQPNLQTPPHNPLRNCSAPPLPPAPACATPQSVERLDPREGRWRRVADMAAARGAHACTAGPGGLLYVVGGFDVTSADTPYMATGGCGQVMPKLGAMWGAAVLHAVAGAPNPPSPRNPPLLHPTPVEAYDPRMGVWAPRAAMRFGRAYGAAAYAGGALWAVGGMLGDQAADGSAYNELLER